MEHPSAFPEAFAADLSRLFFGASKADFMREIRQIVREEIQANQDRKSFHAASNWMNQQEVMEYLAMSRSALTARRNARKRAKPCDKDSKFAPEYGDGKNLRFKRDEIDAWLGRQAKY